MTHKALKLALEFIENSECGTADLEALIKEALREHAMREVQRLGQEIEQEPVAWMDEFGNVFPLGAQRGPKHLNEPMKPLYTTPPQPEQKPVVWMYQDKSTHEVRFQKHMRGFVDHGATYETPLYTTSSQRTWVGLTDEEVKDIVWNLPYEPSQEHIRAIEAKLKDKNT